MEEENIRMTFIKYQIRQYLRVSNFLIEEVKGILIRMKERLNLLRHYKMIMIFPSNQLIITKHFYRPLQDDIDRTLQTQDIEGAIPGTLISKVVKNKDKALQLKQKELQYKQQQLDQICNKILYIMSVEIEKELLAQQYKEPAYNFRNDNRESALSQMGQSSLQQIPQSLAKPYQPYDQNNGATQQQQQYLQLQAQLQNYPNEDNQQHKYQQQQTPQLQQQLQYQQPQFQNYTPQESQQNNQQSQIPQLHQQSQYQQQSFQNYTNQKQQQYNEPEPLYYQPSQHHYIPKKKQDQTIENSIDHEQRQSPYLKNYGQQIVHDKNKELKLNLIGNYIQERPAARNYLKEDYAKTRQLLGIRDKEYSQFY